jgi:hypothetical protein
LTKWPETCLTCVSGGWANRPLMWHKSQIEGLLDDTAQVVAHPRSEVA